MISLIQIFLVLVVVWLILFMFPWLLHPRKSQPQAIKTILNLGRPLKIGHRGCPRHIVENTLQGFEKVKNVADSLQMDVCNTADNFLVVHHDHGLQRTCGTKANVQDYKFSDLPRFREEIVLDFAIARRVKSQKERIPKLQQVFMTYPHTIMNIELKTPTDSAMAELIRLLNKYNRKDITIIGVRNHRNKQFLQTDPQIRIFMNDKKVHTLALCYFLGLVPFLKIVQSSLQIPVYSKQYEDWHVGRTPHSEKWRARLFMKMIKFANFVCRPLLWHLKRRGILCYGWVCNTQQAYSNAIKSGFQGIMSDDVFALDKYLNSINQRTDKKQ